MTTRAGLLNRLLDPERVVVFDGAMGTMLYAKGVFINQCYDELNLRAPDLIRKIHRARHWPRQQTTRALTSRSP